MSHNVQSHVCPCPSQWALLRAFPSQLSSLKPQFFFSFCHCSFTVFPGFVYYTRSRTHLNNAIHASWMNYLAPFTGFPRSRNRKGNPWIPLDSAQLDPGNTISRTAIIVISIRTAPFWDRIFGHYSSRNEWVRVRGAVFRRICPYAKQILHKNVITFHRVAFLIFFVMSIFASHEHCLQKSCSLLPSTRDAILLESFWIF